VFPVGDRVHTCIYQNISVLKRRHLDWYLCTNLCGGFFISTTVRSSNVVFYNFCVPAIQFTNKCTHINYFYSFISIDVYPYTCFVPVYIDTNKTIKVVYVCAFVGKLNSE
jgi:hypothetical protein